jgi:hypothetical protein
MVYSNEQAKQRSMRYFYAMKSIESEDQEDAMEIVEMLKQQTDCGGQNWSLNFERARG